VLSLYSQQWLLASISGLTFPEESPSALQGKRWGGMESEEREEMGEGEGKKEPAARWKEQAKGKGGGAVENKVTVESQKKGGRRGA
jgi:hypothetical protein